MEEGHIFSRRNIWPREIEETHAAISPSQSAGNTTQGSPNRAQKKLQQIEMKSEEEETYKNYYQIIATCQDTWLFSSRLIRCKAHNSSRMQLCKDKLSLLQERVKTFHISIAK